MKPKYVVVRVLRVILGLFFVMDGVIKLTGISKTVQLFERIGWGQWFRYLSGCIVLVGGALVILRLRWTFVGAILCRVRLGRALYSTLSSCTVTLRCRPYSHCWP